MPTFSKRSLDNLAACHPDLQKVAHEAIKHLDFTVICGHRGREAQNKAYKKGSPSLSFRIPSITRRPVTPSTPCLTRSIGTTVKPSTRWARP